MHCLHKSYRDCGDHCIQAIQGVEAAGDLNCLDNGIILRQASSAERGYIGTD